MTENPPQNPEDPRPVTHGDPLGDSTAGPPPQEEPTREQPPPAAAAKRLTRSGEDRVIGGVAGGIARHLEIDALLVRIVLGVLAVAFPPTIIGYLAALVFVPRDGAPPTDPDTRNRVVAAVLVGALLLIVLPIALPFGFIAGPPLLGIAVPVLFIAGLIWLVMRVLGTEDAGSGRRIVAALGIVLLAVAGFFASITAAVFGAGWVVAGIVILCGVALMAAAFAGGARWLLAPALLLALPLAGVAAADVKLDGGVGDREYRAYTVSDIRDVYELGAGEMEIDLRDVRFPVGDTRVRIDVGMGEVRVLVPEEVCVVPDIHVGAGQVRIGDRQQAGVDIDWSERPDGTGIARVILDAELGMGELRVGDSRFSGFMSDDEFFEGQRVCV